jgi:glucose-1-phosphatase
MMYGIRRAPSEYKNIIFDLGGVIINLSLSQTLAAFREKLPNLSEEGFVGKVRQVDLYDNFETGKLSAKEFRQRFCQHYEISLNDEDFDYCWNGMILDIPLERIELLKKLRQEGKRLFLLSNINEIHEIAVEKSYSMLKLKEEFRSLFDKTYYSHRVGMRKPDRAIFEYVVNDNHLKKEDTLFIDDSIQHIESARLYGVDAVHLTDGLRIESLRLSSQI